MQIIQDQMESPVRSDLMLIFLSGNRLKEDKVWLYGPTEFYCANCGVVLDAVSKSRRCIQDVKIRGFAL